MNMRKHPRLLNCKVTAAQVQHHYLPYIGTMVIIAHRNYKLTHHISSTNYFAFASSHMMNQGLAGIINKSSSVYMSCN